MADGRTDKCRRGWGWIADTADLADEEVPGIIQKANER
jgi:hypothetical protein